MNKFLRGFFAAGALGLVAGSANASWSIVDIGGMGGSQIFANSINDLGQITGFGTTKDISSAHVFITDVNGTNITDLGNFSGTEPRPDDINNIGQVVGQYIHPTSGLIKGFITEPNGSGMTDFGIFTDTEVWISGINDSGAVTGVYLSTTSERSFVADANGTNIRDIGTLAGSMTVAKEINNLGQVVGYSTSSNGTTHAFLTNIDGHGIRDLGVLDEKYYTNSTAEDVNNSGQVVGTSFMNSGMHHAFITGDDGTGMINLGTLGGSSSMAVAINDAGMAVGVASDGVGIGNNHSFIYANGGLTDLSVLPEVVNAGWTDIFVTDINNNGQIVGWGYLENDPGNEHSFLLSFTSDTVFTPQDLYIPPVPEPSTYLMLLAGLGLLGLRRFSS